MNKKELKLEALKILISYVMLLATLTGGAFITLIAYFWVSFNTFKTNLEIIFLCGVIGALVGLFSACTYFISKKVRMLNKGIL